MGVCAHTKDYSILGFILLGPIIDGNYVVSFRALQVSQSFVFSHRRLDGAEHRADAVVKMPVHV